MIPSKPAPWRRMALTGCALVAVLVAGAVFHSLLAHGVFNAVESSFAGQCRVVAGPAGPEDIALDPVSKMAILSATDRRALKNGKPSKADGLYAYAYGVAGARPVKLSGTPANFHPHGISLYRGADGKLTLYVINHPYKAQNAIVTFGVTIADGKVQLNETGFIGSDLLKSPNAIAAVDEARFYVVNDHTVSSDAGRWLDDNLSLPRADALYFDSTKFAVAANRLNFPNGIVVSPDGRFVYIAEKFARRIVAFERDPFLGRLKNIGELAIPANLDNLRLGDDGALWVSGTPKAYALSDYRHDPAKVAPSVVYRVSLQDGLPTSFEQIFADSGAHISGSSVGAFANGHLLIGSAFDTKIMDCSTR